MNDTSAKPAPRARASQFNSTKEFWDRTDSHPEEFLHLDVTGLLAMAREVEDRVKKRERNGSDSASKNGTKREKTGTSSDERGPEPQTNGAKRSDVGPGRPPVENRFQTGNPGGPGRPKGPQSMRKLIRTALFEEDVYGEFAIAVVQSLFRQAIKGNTHAIRLIVENGNNRRVRR